MHIDGEFGGSSRRLRWLILLVWVWKFSYINSLYRIFGLMNVLLHITFIWYFCNVGFYFYFFGLILILLTPFIEIKCHIFYANIIYFPKINDVWFFAEIKCHIFYANIIYFLEIKLNVIYFTSIIMCCQHWNFFAA